MPLPITQCPPTVPQWLCRLAPTPLINAIAFYHQHETAAAVAELIGCLAVAVEDPIEAEVCLRVAILKVATQAAKQTLRDLGRWLRSSSASGEWLLRPGSLM